MNQSNLAAVETWLAYPMEKAVAQAIERMRTFEDVARVAVMPDVHLARDVCVGTVMATHRLLYPAAVGGDIGCGMLAMAFDETADALRSPKIAGTILRLLAERIPGARRHRRHTLPTPAELSSLTLSHPSLAAVAASEGVLQLGTLGGGNHFVELQSDVDNRLWLMIHSGSRALGQEIRDFHLAQGTIGRGKMIALDATEERGRAYINDVHWARAYADANRKAMATIVAGIVSEVIDAAPDDSSLFCCDHNHVQCETHFGKLLQVHRKGAMSADERSFGIVPGSMGTRSYHVIGKGCLAALRSSAHGAGRRLSRSQARQAFAVNDLRRQMGRVWYDPRMANALRDEAPRAYNNVGDVMAAQKELVTPTRILEPLLSYKGR